MKRILISAAEPSGDVLASELVTAIRQLGQAEFIGLTGPRMRNVGVESIAKMETISAMGVAEVIGHLPAIHKAKRALINLINHGIDAAIFIDAPDLHLPLAKRARKSGAISIGYVSPQIWAWRASRVKTITSSFDQLLCLFEFEPKLYGDFDARWVGHPVVDRQRYRQAVDQDLFGLTPGSRRQETDRMLGPFIRAAEHVRSIRPTARFTLVSPVTPLRVPSWIEHTKRIEDLNRARAVLTKSGTITLELAVMGVPQVVAHRVHPVTHWLGRKLVQGIEHIAMPNILSQSAVVPEYIQDLNPMELATALLKLPEHQAIDLRPLGEPGAIQRAANAVWTKLEAA